ncbi:MAG: NADPH-dependent reductase, partial [Gemmatimonadetes bacterium]|nr:NADPH-dependent reductase [Gemmatimonadota bacterium]
RSSNTAVLQRAAMLGGEWFTAQFYDELGALPAFNPDVEELGEAHPQWPAAVQRLRRAVAEADALLVSTPEYAHGLPGTLKNALDWLVGSVDFPGIPVGLVNISARSTHAPAQLLETVRTMSAVVVADAVITLQATTPHGTSGQHPAETQVDEALRRALRALHAAAESSPRQRDQQTTMPDVEGIITHTQRHLSR